MKVYVQLWIRIQCRPTIALAAHHVFETVNQCHQMLLSLQEMVMPVVDRNALGAHPESVLIPMLSGGNKVHQELALRKILRSLKKKLEMGRIRIFRVPKINRDATNSIEILD